MENYVNNNKVNVLAILLGMLIGIILCFNPLTRAIKIISGIIVLILILYKAEIGLYFTAFLLPLVSFRYVVLLFGLVMLSFLLNIIRDKDFKLKQVPLRYSFILFIIPLVFGSITSITLKQSMIKLIVYSLAFIFLFISINLIDRKEKLYYLIMAFIIAATIVGVYGLYQYSTGVELKESWLDREKNPGIETRVISTFDNPNILAEYLILTIPLTFVLVWNTRSIFKRILFLLSLMAQGLCILLTFSRGGWLGLLLAMLVFAVFIDWKLLFLYILGGLGLTVLNPKAIMTRISTIGSVEDSSNAYRIPLWKATLDMIKKFWINGVGLGMNAFRAVYPRYMRQGIVAVHSHNIFLQLFIELGIFGFIGFIVFIFNIMRMNLITFAKGMDIKIKRISIAVLSSMLGILLHGLVDYIFFNDRIIMALWIVISIGLVGYILEFSNREEQDN